MKTLVWSFAFLMGLLCGAVHAADEPQPKVPEIAEVKTLEELRAVKPITLDDGWEVRIGLSDGGADAGPWKLLYCLAKPVRRKEQAAPQKALESSAAPQPLGPVLFVVKDPSNDRGHAMLIQKSAGIDMSPEDSLLYCGLVPLAWKGTYRIRVCTPYGHPLLETTVRVDEVQPCYWQTFAEEETVERTDEELTTASLEPDPNAASPAYEGWHSLWRFGPEERRLGEEKTVTPLPGKIPLAEEPYLRQMLNKEAVKLEDVGKEPPPLVLKLDGDTFVVRSRVHPFRLPAGKNLLARWWVNGKPVEAARAQEVALAGESAQAAEAQTLRVRFGVLPKHLAAKVGDKLALQVLYCPAGYEKVFDSRNAMIQERAMRARSEARTPGQELPLLSNRIEFVVTKAMLRKPAE